MSEPTSGVKRKADAHIRRRREPPHKRSKWWQTKRGRFAIGLGVSILIAAAAVSIAVATGGLAVGAEGAMLSGYLMTDTAATVLSTGGEVAADLLADTAAGAGEQMLTEAASEAAAYTGEWFGEGVEAAAESIGEAGGEVGEVGGETGEGMGETAEENVAKPGRSGKIDISEEAVNTGRTSGAQFMREVITSRYFWYGLVTTYVGFEVIGDVFHPINTYYAVKDDVNDMRKAGKYMYHLCEFNSGAREDPPDRTECPEGYLHGLRDYDEVSAYQLGVRYGGVHHITKLTDDDKRLIDMDFKNHHFKKIPKEKDPYFNQSIQSAPTNTTNTPDITMKDGGGDDEDDAANTTT